MRALASLVLVLVACGDNARPPCGDGTCAVGESCQADADCIAGDACGAVVCNPYHRCDRVAYARCARAGAFCDIGRAGLDGCNIRDSDGDGFQDDWETPQPYITADGSVAMNATPGIDFDCDGVIEPTDLALPDARPDVKDVYLEYAYLEAPTHSHMPSESSLQTVELEYAARHPPITLHIDRNARRIDERAVTSFDLRPIACDAGCLPGQTCHDNICENPICPDTAVCPVSGTPCKPGRICNMLDPACAGTDAYCFDDLKNTFLDERRQQVYHYALFAHFNTCADDAHCGSGRCQTDPTTGAPPVFGSIGVAEQPGNDIIVSAPAGMEATALIQELDHNLNLHDPFRDWPGAACTMSSDCPTCATCPPGDANVPLARAELPDACPIGTTGGCHLPCVAGQCVPVELAMQCRDE